MSFVEFLIFLVWFGGTLKSYEELRKTDSAFWAFICCFSWPVDLGVYLARKVYK